MKLLTWIFTFSISFLVVTEAAEAQSILGNACVNMSVEEGPSNARIASAFWGGSEQMYLAAIANSGVMGLSCSNIRKIDHSILLIGLAIAPAVEAIKKSPALRSAMATELAQLSAAVGSPAILSATVIGAFGIVTFKVLLTLSLEECDHQDRELLKEELSRELDLRYGFRANSQTSIQVTR